MTSHSFYLLGRAIYNVMLSLKQIKAYYNQNISTASKPKTVNSSIFWLLTFGCNFFQWCHYLGSSRKPAFAVCHNFPERGLICRWLWSLCDEHLKRSRSSLSWHTWERTAFLNMTAFRSYQKHVTLIKVIYFWSYWNVQNIESDKKFNHMTIF